ncbi:MAG: iron-containing alcohol dehydrogenase family protein [Pirellulaceae bacterium]
MSGMRALETNLQINRDSSLISFDFAPRTRMVFGNDSIDQLGQQAAGLGVKRVLVVSDPGIVEAGHSQHGVDALTKAGLTTALFDEAHENPTTDDVQRGVEFAREFEPELLVGLGGGSSMDCAKGINFIYSCGGQMSDYWGVDKATGPMLPMIAVPTTAGTGSEMQSFALISDAASHAKMACGDKRASSLIAVLDPKLTLTQPSQVTALTGIDAISHALETFVTRPRNPVSMLLSREAWRLLSQNFLTVLEDPDNLEARGAMLLGAAWSGLAIENSMLGAAHALVNPLSAAYDTAHGQGIGVLLPHVIRFNGQQFDDWYTELTGISAGFAGAPEADSGSQGIADFVERMVKAAGLETSLQGLGVVREQIPELAEAASRQWTGQFNPRPLDTPSLITLYENAY